MGSEHLLWSLEDTSSWEFKAVAVERSGQIAFMTCLLFRVMPWKPGSRDRCAFAGNSAAKNVGILVIRREEFEPEMLV